MVDKPKRVGSNIGGGGGFLLPIYKLKEFKFAPKPEAVSPGSERC